MNHNKRTIITVTLVILFLVSLSSIYVGYKLGKTSSRTDEIQTTRRQTTSSKHSGILTQNTDIRLTPKTTPEDPDMGIFNNTEEQQIRHKHIRNMNDYR